MGYNRLANRDSIRLEPLLLANADSGSLSSTSAESPARVEQLVT
jgi:hypothetical protein